MQQTDHQDLAICLFRACGCFIEVAYIGLRLESVSRQAAPQDDGYGLGHKLDQLKEMRVGIMMHQAAVKVTVKLGVDLLQK